MGQWGRFTQSFIPQEKCRSRENNILGPLLQASRQKQTKKKIEGGDCNVMEESTGEVKDGHFDIWDKIIIYTATFTIPKVKETK